MKPPITLSSEIVYNGYFDLRKDQLVRPDGLLHDYTFLYVHWDAVVVIPETSDGRLIVNREYRPPAEQFVLGFPGGCLEKEEEPRIGAQRELFEESGYWSDDIQLLGCCYPLPGLCNQKIFFFHAKNAVERGKSQLDPFEFIETELKTEDELRREIKAGAPIDGLLGVALWYKSLATC